MRRSLLAEVVGTDNKIGQGLFVVMSLMAVVVLLGFLFLAPELLDRFAEAISSSLWMLASTIPMLFIALAGIL